MESLCRNTASELKKAVHNAPRNEWCGLLNGKWYCTTTLPMVTVWPNVEESPHMYSVNTSLGSNSPLWFAHHSVDDKLKKNVETLFTA